MITTTYEERNAIRQQKLNEATQSFIEYFVEIGDDQKTAEQKVSDLSTEVALYLYPYILGNTKPLLKSIQDSTLDFMNQDAKDTLISYLSNI